MNKVETSMHDFYEKDPFNRIGEAIAKELKFKRIFLDDFSINEKDYSFIIVEYNNGTIEARNAIGNSLIADIRELGNLLNGGYYKEVEIYKSLKEKLNRNGENR